MILHKSKRQIYQQHIQQEANKVKKPLARFVMKPGMKLFSLNLKTAEIEEVNPDTVKLGTKSKKVQTEDGFLYEIAINKKNVERKFKQQLWKILNA